MANRQVTRSFLVRANTHYRTLYFWETFRGISPDACAIRARAVYPRGKFQFCDVRPVAISSSIAGDAYTSFSEALRAFRAAE